MAARQGVSRVPEQYEESRQRREEQACFHSVSYAQSAALDNPK